MLPRLKLADAKSERIAKGFNKAEYASSIYSHKHNHKKTTTMASTWLALWWMHDQLEWQTYLCLLEINGLNVGLEHHYITQIKLLCWKELVVRFTNNKS